MIWLALRRHRTNFLIVLGLVFALGVWMAAVYWQFRTAPVIRVVTVPAHGLLKERQVDYGPRLFQLTSQVSEINALLLVFPCLAGSLLGAPLVAGEYDDRTNRLAWTQGIGRARWFATKWVVVGFPLVVLAATLAVATHLWSFHVVGAGPGWLDAFSNFNRMQPVVFPVSGVVPVAYTLFAFALGAALGSLVRRTTWAVVGTLVVYGLALLVMTTSVRPLLAPQLFVSSGTAGISATDQQLLYGTTVANGPAGVGGAQPWLLSSGFRFVPGFHPRPGTPSPDAIVVHCEYHAPDPSACIGEARVVDGTTFQPAANYWMLQWRESAIYVAASLLLFALGLWAVRRWQA